MLWPVLIVELEVRKLPLFHIAKNCLVRLVLVDVRLKMSIAFIKKHLLAMKNVFVVNEQ